ncbi:hypothetical protein ACOJBM_36820 [Rhizobium beringeri]
MKAENTAGGGFVWIQEIDGEGCLNRSSVERYHHRCDQPDILANTLDGVAEIGAAQGGKQLRVEPVAGHHLGNPQWRRQRGVQGPRLILDRLPRA